MTATAWTPRLDYLGADEQDAWERYRRDTAEHQLTIKRDDELYRHLRIQQPGTWSYGHDIVTWPGYLAVTGDMGSFLFCRVADMFDFFESTHGSISPGYWAEKMPTEGGRRSVRQFDAGQAKQYVDEWLGRTAEEMTTADVAALREAVRDDVLDRLDDGGEHGFRSALRDFRHELPNGQRVTFPSDDWWDSSWDRYSYQFLWCCWAIVGAIRMYRDAKAVAA